MKKKLGKYFLVSFLLLFFPLLSFSQTIIKEKVRVSPKQTLSKIPNEVQEELQLEFQIGGALPLTTTVVGPTDTQSGSGSGGANPFVYLYFPPLNGDYQITISSTLSAGQRTEVGYTAIYEGQGINYGSRWLYNGGEETAVVSTTINITITTLPEGTPVDFGFEFNRYYICARDESGLVITYYNKEVTPTTNVKFSIISSVAGVELYNKNTGEVITNETTVHINDVPNLSIRLSVPYQGSDANVKVTAEINGATGSDSLIIHGSGDYFRLYSVKRIWDMLEGGTIEMTVEMEGESNCDDVRLQDSTKYNLTITQGEAFGHIKHPVTGELVTTANNLPHENGKLKFKFTADGELPTSEEWAHVRVTTTNLDISPYDFIIKIHKEGMIVTLVPEAIMPGDTASIILKKKNADGTLSDFPEDQYYDAEIIGGAEYGTLYVPQWGDLSDYLLDIPPGFKFIAEEGITEPRVESTILVRTTAGIIWGRVTPGKINNQSSVQNTTEDEQLWGSGTITIGEANDTAYVKAHFAEESLVPGEAVDVIVKKVDKEGNETEFPSNTLFEVGIKEGCTAGNILTSNGELGQYFINVNGPIRFVVNGSLSTADTNIVLRVGVPSDESTTYLPYEGMAPSGKVLPPKGNRNTVTNQASDYCVLNQFEYSGFGLASGKIPQLEIIYPADDSPNETITSEPQMPTVICKARLKNYNGGQVTFEWEYTVSNILPRRNAITGNPLCPREAKIIIEGTSTANNSAETEWIVPFKKENLKYYLAKAVSPNNCESTITNWFYGNDIYFGGDVSVKVTTKDPSGRIIATDAKNANKILGNNFDFGIIRNYKNDNKILAIIIKESYGGKQFNFSSIEDDYHGIGFPLYGPPNGFGLTQMDNPAATELELWNWKSNTNAGEKLFYGDKKRLTEKKLRYVSQISPEEFLLEHFQKYRGGNYWKLSDDKRKIIGKYKPYNKEKELYGDSVMRIYKNLNSN